MVFRVVRNKANSLSSEECLEILRREKRGVLSVLGDGGYPYAVPMNHFYNDEDGRLYFHCGRAGHRLDSLKRCDKVSFCCLSVGKAAPGSWEVPVRSVVVFGRIEIVDDLTRVCDIAARLSRKFTDDEAFIAREIERSAKATLLLILSPEQICGKKVTES